ncbi:MAG TPA: hypothetical protein VF511_03795, partial [Chthoniobacterales bacterium]
MSRSLAIAVLSLALTAQLAAQESTATPEKRGGWFTRMLHPFQSSNAAPNYKDARLRGLVLEMKLSPEPVKLSEVRQLQVDISLKNVSKRGVVLDFPSEQRFE